ncbi:MAG: H-X9-DG-CTERM domain-containing protein, partial [Armatimonadota bacterium]
QHDYAKGNRLTPFDSGPVSGSVHFRHNKGFNVLFVDSHTKWLKKTTQDMWAADPSNIRDPAAKAAL